MSDKKGAQQGKTKLTLSQRECELLAAAWLSIPGNPQMDWDKFADLAGFKNAHSARTCFGPLKKRLLQQYDPPAAAGEIKPYTYKPRTRKKKNPEGEEAGGDPTANANAAGASGSGDAEAGPSPSKRAKTGPATAAAAPAVFADADADAVDDAGIV